MKQDTLIARAGMLDADHRIRWHGRSAAMDPDATIQHGMDMDPYATGTSWYRDCQEAQTLARRAQLGVSVCMHSLCAGDGIISVATRYLWC